jgi:hypothetical protein
MAGTTRPHRAVTLTAGGVPRIVEPLFTVFGDGDSSGGSTSGRNWQDDDLMLQQYQMPVGGKIVAIMPWIRSGTGLLRVAAYDSGAGEPGDLLAVAELNVVTPPDEFLEVPLSESDYIDVLEDDFLWLGVQADGSKGSRTAATPAVIARRIVSAPYGSGLPDPAPSMGGYAANRPLRVKIWTNPT